MSKYMQEDILGLGSMVIEALCIPDHLYQYMLCPNIPDMCRCS